MEGEIGCSLFEIVEGGGREGNHVFWASIVPMGWLYFCASFVRLMVLL